MTQIKLPIHEEVKPSARGRFSHISEQEYRSYSSEQKRIIDRFNFGKDIGTRCSDATIMQTSLTSMPPEFYTIPDPYLRA